MLNVEQLRRNPRPTNRGDWGKLHMNLDKKGFSLIELLVVIAIIGILAAIIFPVFARAKDAAYRTGDMTGLNEIRTAVQLYRTDQGAYPPALFGYATGYMPDGVTQGDPQPTTANIVPADLAAMALFPKRVSSLETFRPAYNRGTTSDFNKQFVTAVWPTGLGTGLGAGQSNQRFGPETEANRCVLVGGTPTQISRYFYKVSGYDSAFVKSPDGERNELRYAPFWSGWTVPADPCNPAANEKGNSADTTRQLGYTDPPDSTVVTWDSWFREYDDNNNVQSGSKRDIVLFLGGSARPFDSKSVVDQAYALNP